VTEDDAIADGEIRIVGNRGPFIVISVAGAGDRGLRDVEEHIHATRFSR